MKRNAFTLLELTLLTSILSLVAAIVSPRLADIRERAQIAEMKVNLRHLVSAEEYYLAEHQRYATHLGRSYAVSPNDREPTITLTRDGWTASITSRNTTRVCAVFVGSTPLAPASREGAPACARGESSTTRSPY
ncbi:MAG TPA: hypothetical protein VIW28_12260 [Gemmatimonadales bacterium]|jgi:type II secretory pathway pseudopilin PulG